MSAYSPHKALRHLDVIQAVRDRRPARPVHVQVILSDLCNQACGFCAYRDPSYSSSQRFYEIKVHGPGLRRDDDHPERNYNPNRMIPWPKVVEILDDCQAMGVRGIQFTGGGEPTVHPQFVAACEEALNRGMEFAVVTNGVNAGARGYASVLARAAWVRVSIDAATSETYCKTRGVPVRHWEMAWKCVRDLREARDASGTETVIGVGFVVTPENWHEIHAAAKLAKTAGADNIRIGAQFSAEDERLFEGFHHEAAALAQAAESLSDNGFTVFNRFGEKLDDLRSKSPDYDVCGYQQFTTYIGADLNVYRCCVQAYNDRGLVGSIRDRRFADLWMSQDRADAMARFSARSCERCQFNGQNRLLNYVLRADEPEHAAFV